MSRLAPIVLCLAVTSTAYGEGPDDAEAAGDAAIVRSQREYTLLFGGLGELEPLAEAGVTLNKALTDAYMVGIGPHLPESVEGVARTVWQVWWTFNLSLWPHELGHWARARQVGGEFVIEGYGVPFPIARMDLPDDLDKPGGIVTSVGGFEVNHLMMRQTHVDFYDRGYSHGDTLVHAFIQEFYYSLYGLLVAWTDPDDPAVWTDTFGDPVEWVLSVHQSHTGRPALRADGSVDPDLSSLYTEALLVDLGALLLDPLAWQTARGFAMDMDDDWAYARPWRLGDEDLGWMYGLRFLPTPLGWELTLANYLSLGGRLYVVSVKGGRPYRNLGARVNVPSALAVGPARVGVAVDVWDQDVWGRGAAAYLDVRFRLFDGLHARLRGGYKSDGYLVGQHLDDGPLVLAGLSWEVEAPLR